MADPKDDDSTDIEAKVEAFAKDMTKCAETLRKARETSAKGTKDEGKKIPVVKFSMSKNKVSKSRTPAEQAKEVVGGKSYVCWSSHMADKARHVLMTVDGKASWEPKEAFGDDFDQFTKEWGAAMKKHGLKNAEGNDGWPSWDEFHLELPESKMSTGDKRAQACLDEYAKLTRKDGKKQNKKFEDKYKKLLQPHIDKYEKKK